MKYILVYTQRAVKDIKKLDILVRKRIAKKIVCLRSNPRKIAKKLIHPKLGTYRYKIGEYRVIFDIDKNKVVILRVGHRRDI